MKTIKGLTTFAIFALGVTFMSCSHVKEGKRETASMNDMGIIGPKGSVLLYYRDGDFIIVKNCDANTVLGNTPAEARANCKSRESNKVPVESFKMELRNLVSIDRLNSLMPITPDEVTGYPNVGASTAQTESMIIELDKINAFITRYGAENANIVRRDELVRSLKSNEDRMKVINKINAEIEKAISFITDQSTLTLKKFNTDKDQFLFTILYHFNLHKPFPCGLTGPIEDRIRDCTYSSFSSDSFDNSFVLVTTTKDLKVIYKDTKSGILWGDRLPLPMNHYDALKACKADLPEVGGISGVTWKLPTKEEYEAATTSGITSVLPRMGERGWWTSSVVSDNTNSAFVYAVSHLISLGGQIEQISRDYERGSVRCVGVVK